MSKKKDIKEVELDQENLNTEVINDRPNVVLPLVETLPTGNPYSDLITDSVKQGKAQVAELEAAFKKGTEDAAKLKAQLERIQLGITVINAQIDTLVNLQKRATETKPQ